MKKPIVYDYMCDIICEKVGTIDGTIDRTEFKNKLRYFGIPRHLWNRIIKEMEDLNYFQRINKQKIKIKKTSKRIN